MMRGKRAVTATLFVALLLALAVEALAKAEGSAFSSSVQVSESYVPPTRRPFLLPQTESLKVVTDYRGLKEEDVTKPGAVDISALGAEIVTKLGKGLKLTTTYVRSRSGLGAEIYSEPEVLGLTLARSLQATPSVRVRGEAGLRRYLTRFPSVSPEGDKFAGAFRRYKLEAKGRLKASLSYTQVEERFTPPTPRLAEALQQSGLLAPVTAMKGTRHLDFSLEGELLKGLKLSSSYERLKTASRKEALLKRLSLTYGKGFEVTLGEVEVGKGFEPVPALDEALASKLGLRSALGLGWMDRKGFRSVKAIGGLEERFRALKLTPSFGLGLVHKARELSLGEKGKEVKLVSEELFLRGLLKLTREYRRVGGALPNAELLGISDWQLLDLLKGREREITSLEFRPSRALSLAHKAYRLRWAGGDAVLSFGELRLGEVLKVTRHYGQVSAQAPAPEELAKMMGFGEDRTYAALQGKEREVLSSELRLSKTLSLIHLVERERGLDPEAHPFLRRTLGGLRLAPAEGWTVTVEEERVAREMRVKGRAPQREGETARRAVRIERALKQGEVMTLFERREERGPRGEEVETSVKDISLRTRALGGLMLTTRYREESPERGPSWILRELGLKGPIRAFKGASFLAQLVEGERGGRKEQGTLRVALEGLRLGEEMALTTEFKREERGQEEVTTRLAQIAGRPFKGWGVKPLEGLVLTTAYRAQKPTKGEAMVRREVKATLPLQDLLPLVGGEGKAKLTALVISEEGGGRTTVHREFYLDTLRLAFKPKEELGLDVGLAVGRAEKEAGGREIPMSLVRFGGRILGLNLAGEYAVGRKETQRILMKAWSLSGRVLGGLKLSADYRWNLPKGEKRLSVAQVPLEWQPGGMLSLSLAREEEGKPKWGTTYNRELDVRGRVTWEQYRVSYERASSGLFRGDLSVTNQYVEAKARRYELGLSHTRVISPERHEISFGARLSRLDFRAPSAKDKTDYELTTTYRLPVSW